MAEQGVQREPPMRRGWKSVLLGGDPVTAVVIPQIADEPHRTEALNPGFVLRRRTSNVGRKRTHTPHSEPMMKRTTCTKCGSDDVIDGLQVASCVDTVSSVPLSIVTYNEPNAKIFKKPQSHQIHARVCRGCGCTELYIKEPQALPSLIRAEAASPD